MAIRRGYTLLELLIVVAILAVVTALAWPALRSPWGRSRIEEAGHLVRVAMARARVEAIESATPYQFRFCPSTGMYEYGPAVFEQSGDDVAPLDSRGSPELLDSDSNASVSNFGDSDEWEPEDLTIQEELPGGVRFVDPLAEEAGITGSIQLDANPETPSGLDTLENADWSTPIVFYPNGRSMSARIRLTSVDRRGIEVVLRGLTGTAKVGKPFVMESTDEASSDRIDEDVNEPIDNPNPEPERSEQDDE